ncbi:DUF3347 domain-containing protein [Hydrotalea sp.]|uniref:DUF3347 domain-containing protein n=1 Tax=Hydrotalea sp. TaxID=2881279 RepID=UPI002620EF6A|nr:DUF3347 domain-containing protein [Hydrotalea sp.]
MKTKLSILLTATLFFIAACTNKSNKENNMDNMSKSEMDNMNKTDTVKSENKDITTISATFTNINPTIKSSLAKIITDYLNIKNALANDNGSEAASASQSMLKSINQLDESLFTADQKKEFDKIAGDLQENAEHIGDNADKIKHQRFHFASMSNDMYVLVKTFGTGRLMYQDHCPMFNENKGAIWISETKEIKNPYLGTEMLTCGTIEEIIN